MIYRRTAAQWILMAAPLLTLVPSQEVQRAPQHRPERPAEIRLPEERQVTNLDAFRAQFSEYSRGPLHTRTRRAICAVSSSAVGCVAEVTIQAIGLSKDILAARGPVRGRVIGQIRNLDLQDMTEMDSLKPSSKADYYIYIDAAPGGRARWSLLEVPNVREGIIRRIVQEEVNQCYEKPGFRWRRSDVDFAHCGDHYLRSLSGAEMVNSTGLTHFISSFAAGLHPRSAYVEPGKWYACPSGCCT